MSVSDKLNLPSGLGKMERKMQCTRSVVQLTDTDSSIASLAVTALLSPAAPF